MRRGGVWGLVAFAVFKTVGRQLCVAADGFDSHTPLPIAVP